jgi:hypothetical protein
MASYVLNCIFNLSPPPPPNHGLDQDDIYMMFTMILMLSTKLILDKYAKHMQALINPLQMMDDL